jgi:hypothetical protein
MAQEEVKTQEKVKKGVRMGLMNNLVRTVGRRTSGERRRP